MNMERNRGRGQYGAAADCGVMERAARRPVVYILILAMIAVMALAGIAHTTRAPAGKAIDGLSAWGGGTAGWATEQYAFRTRDGTYDSPGTAGNPYVIGSGEELALLAGIVNSGAYTESYNKACYELENDIELNELSLLNVWSEGLAPRNKWTPIGQWISGSDFSKAFQGVFDGAGHEVRGIYINTASGYQGLFGVVHGGTIKNLGVAQSYIKGGSNIGGVAGYVRENSSVESCYNTGNVVGSVNSIGGIVGNVYTSSSVTNCYNTGRITGSGNNTGGVAGYVYTNSSVTNCYNTGNIVGGVNSAGGVAGYLYTSSMTNCYNTGSVTGSSNTGGVAGYVYTNSSVANCNNTGSVMGSGVYTGGVAGFISNSSMTNCYNIGSVASKSDRVGGVAGYVAVNSSATNCYNTGSVTGNNQIGGIAGNVDNGSVTNCYNTGSVAGGGSYTGGVVGYVISSSSVTNCYNTGSVTGITNTGGVAGRVSSSTVNYCYYLKAGGINGAIYGIGSASSDPTTGTQLRAVTDAVNGTMAGITVGGADYTVLGDALRAWVNSPTLEPPEGISYVQWSGGSFPVLNVGIIGNIWDGSVAGAFAGGKGTEAEPYLISDGAQLARLAFLVNTPTPDTVNDDGRNYNEKSYKLTGNIYLNDPAANGGWVNWDGTAAGLNKWTPIGQFIGASDFSKAFQGVFDGAGYEARGTYINTASQYQGLFGVVYGGIIKNFGVAQGNIKGGNYTGGVAGYLIASSSVTNCYNTGSVTGGTYTGGVMGYVRENSSVTSCYNTGNVTGDVYIGGVAGYIRENSSVTNSYNTGNVTGGNQVGGVAGDVRENSRMANCYNTGSVIGSGSHTGGVAGYVIANSSVTNCYSTGSVTGGGSNTGGVVGYLSGDSTVDYCYYLKAGGINESIYGIGTASSDPVTGTQLRAVTDAVNGTMAGITVGGADYTVLGDALRAWVNSPTPEPPEGVSYVQWSGGGFPTLNVGTTGNIWDGSVAGAFAGGKGTEAEPYLISDGAQLARLAFLVNTPTLDTVNDDGRNYNEKSYRLTNNIYLNDPAANGGRANWGDTATGLNQWTAIGQWISASDCSKAFNGVFDGAGYEVRGTYINTGAQFQGLFGVVYGGTIKNVGVTQGYIKGGNNTGGVAGYVRENGSVTNCYNTGSVTGNGSNTGGVVGQLYTSSSITNCYNTGSVTGTGERTGGVVGYVYTSSSMTNCYNTGSVMGTGDRTGGVAGYVNSSSVSNCYNTGSVTGTGERTGGVAGYVFSGSSITNCYNTGSITGAAFTGGVAGYVNNGSSVTNCYNTGSVTASEGTPGGVIGTLASGTVSGSYFLKTADFNESLNAIGTDEGGTVINALPFGLTGEAGDTGKTVLDLLNKWAVSANAGFEGAPPYLYFEAGGGISGGGIAYRFTQSPPPPETYAVVYDGGQYGAGAIDPQTKTEGRPLTLSSFVFTRYGYTQTGWALSDGGPKAYDLGAEYTEDAPLTLYPVWTAISGIAVNFETDGGTPASPAPLSVTFGSPYGELPLMTKGGYVFGGWWTKDGAGGDWGTQVTAVTAVTNAEGHTLYARWLENEFLITYYDVGGGPLSVPATGLPATFSAAQGTAIPDPVEKQGYAFAGWYLMPDGSGQAVTFLAGGGVYDGNVDLYAKWTPNEYTVVYNSNRPGGGQTESQITGATASSAHKCGQEKALNINGFRLSGWHFTGWAVSADGPVVYTDGQAVTDLTYENGGVVSLFAVWERNRYTVVYHANKPDAASASPAGSMTASQFTYDSAAAEYLTANGFAITGWTFLGWTLSPGGAITDPAAAVVYTDGCAARNLTAVGNGTFSLYAVWRPNTYTVVYHGNQEMGAPGSSGALANSTAASTHTYDSAKALTPSGFTLTGWRFDKWTAFPGGTGTSYTDGQSVNNLTATDGATINLYAQWNANSYTVRYFANAPGGASGAVEGATEQSGHTYDVLDALSLGGFSLTGWTFLGWSRNPDGSGTLYADNQEVKNITADNGAAIALYARWRANTYTVRYDKNGAGAGGDTPSSAHTYDSQKRLTYNGYTRAGWAFEGWATSPGGPAVYADGELILNLTASNNAAITLYAVWSAARFTVTFQIPQHSDIEEQAAYGDPILPLVPEAPPIQGMVFVRWEGLVTGQNAPQVRVTGNHAFTAVYAPDTAPRYTVRFINQDGTEILSKPGAVSGAYIAEILPEVPGLTGWTFVRWDGYEQWMTVTGDHIFTAVFEYDGETGVRRYTVTFFDTDGVTVIHQTLAFEGASISALFPPARQIEGFVFTGWQGYSFGMTVSGDHSFTAEYTAAPAPVYTVTFLAGDGVTAVLRLDGVPQGTMINMLIPPAPVIGGKTFIRWDGFDDRMTVEGSHSFTAVYRDTEDLRYYTVRFIDDDGISLIREITLVPDGTPVLSLFPMPEPFRPGYIFAGWKGYIAGMNVTADLTFTATYTKSPAPAYTVTFLDKWGGVYYQAAGVVYGTLISMIAPPSAPVIEGWTFVSWSGYESWMTVVTGNHVFQAVYREDPVPRDITVRFLDEDGVTVIAVREGVLQGTSISALFPQTPDKPGFIFTGWKYGYEGGWRDYEQGMTAEYDMVFKAVYAADDPGDPLSRYTVSFLNFDDTLIVEYKDVAEGTSVSLLLPAAPPRTGYMFTGWEYRPDGEWLPCPAGLAVMGDMTLRTAWQAVGIVYELTVDGELSGRYEAGSSFYIYITIPQGYEFDRWEYISGVSWIQEPDARGRLHFTMPARSVSFNAVLKPIPVFTVTFDPDNGGTEWTQEVLRGGLIAPVAAPVKSGYMFMGWFAGGADAAWDFAKDTVTEDVTLTARWKQAAYTVTADGRNGGRYEPGTAVTVWLQVPAGKYFDGWLTMAGILSVTDNGDGSFSFVMPENDVELVARYTDITRFTVTFDPDNGGTEWTQSVYEGGLVVPVAVPVKSGYVFIGWYADGADAAWDFAADTVTEDVTLTAVYEALTVTTGYTVTFVDWDGAVLKAETVLSGGGATAPAQPYRAGWTFTGWNAAFDNVTENLVVMALYDRVMFTVTVDAGTGGTVTPGTGSYALGESVTFTITAVTGYHIVSVTLDGIGVIWDGNIYTLTDLSADCVLEVIFAKDTFAITVKQNENGSITPAGADGVYTAEYGEDVTFTITADDGYKVYKVFADGVEIPLTGNGGTAYTFIYIRGAHSIEAQFIPADTAVYTVTFVDYDGTVIDTQSVVHGESAEAPEPPVREGWTFTGWDNYQNVTGDLIVVAQWKENSSFPWLTVAVIGSEAVLLIGAFLIFSKVLSGRKKQHK